MDDLVHVPIMVPADKIGALYAAVAAIMGVSVSSAALTATGVTVPARTAPTPSAAAAAAPSSEVIAAAQAAAGEPGGPVLSGADNGDGTGVDAHGHPWSETLHASTKSQTKEGLWRMKVGVSRPDPMPGFPKTEPAATGGTGTAAPSTAAQASGTATAAAATLPDDEDEFAAFRAAAEATSGPVDVPARKWTDADLGALCNQAAVKLGDPAPVKAIITEHVPADATPHSRNIPQDKREAFAKAIEAKADITFAG